MPKVKRITRPADGVIKPKPTSETTEKPKIKKTTVRKRIFIKKLELAGQCTLRGLQFLQNKAHEELVKRLKVAVPELVVNCEDIYYCW
ncbi:hypothetical protein OSTOST_02001 [Ostertagia ostertagi]